jgi:hypothetical protein
MIVPRQRHNSVLSVLLAVHVVYGALGLSRSSRTHNDMLQTLRRRDPRRKFRQQLGGDEQHAGAAVVEHEAIIVLGH